MEVFFLFIVLIFIVYRALKPSPTNRRRYWYRNVYLKSDAWRRKRYVVLRRDNWTCVRCGNRATQVHHKRYLKKKLGKEPIKWLESICSKCHKKSHRSFF